MNIPLWNSAITNNSEARIARAPALHDGDGLFKWPFGDDAPAPPQARDRWLAASSLREASILLLLNDSKTTPFTFQQKLLPSKAPAPRNPRVGGRGKRGAHAMRDAPARAREHPAQPGTMQHQPSMFREHRLSPIPNARPQALQQVPPHSIVRHKRTMDVVQ